MKGVIFNLLEEVVVREHGFAMWDALLEQAGVDGVYTSLGSYDDAELMRLVTAAAAAMRVGPCEAQRWVGRRAIPLMTVRWPEFFAPHGGTLSFLRTLNGVIHPEVRKLYAGAACPHFDFAAPPGGRLSVGYHSPRRLCGLAHGFIEGTADHYGETVDVDHVECMHRGDARCFMSVHVT